MSAIPKLNGASASKMRGNFVLLRADSMRILLPQQDVSSTDYMDSKPSTTSNAGIFDYTDGDGTPHKVVALSDQMNALTTFPDGRFLLTQMSSRNYQLSFAWSEVRVLIEAEFESTPLPEVMRGPGTLLDSYVELDGELVFCIDARRVLSRTLASLD
jgi:hypothetical protein